MSLATVRRLAADILNVGENRIRIKPDDAKRAAEALTRGDVSLLIRDGVVYKIDKKGRLTKEKKTRRRSWGKVRGRTNKRTKEDWMVVIRSQRKYLRQLVADGSLPQEHKRSVYGKVKSGMFRTKRTMLIYLKENNIVKEVKAEEKKS